MFKLIFLSFLSYYLTICLYLFIHYSKTITGRVQDKIKKYKKFIINIELIVLISSKRNDAQVILIISAASNKQK